MVLTALQKGLGVAGILGFLGLLSMKARAEEPMCECTDWVNADCIDTVTGTRKQIRICNPSGCSIEEQNISDSTCIEIVPEINPYSICKISGFSPEYDGIFGISIWITDVENGINISNAIATINGKPYGLNGFATGFEKHSPAGNYNIMASASGYRDLSCNISIGEGQEAEARLFIIKE